MKLGNKLHIVTFFMCVFMLSACIGKTPHTTLKEAPISSDTGLQSDNGLLGEWATGCLVSFGDRKGYPMGYHYIKRTYFESSTLTVIFALFDDHMKGGSTCSSDSVSMVALYFADYTLGKVINKGSNDEYRTINITNTAVDLAPMDPLTTDMFVVGRSLGVIYSAYGMQWKIAQKQDVTGKENANKLLDIGYMVPDIYQISKMNVNGKTINVLKTGYKRGKLDQDGRPMTLDSIYSAFIKSNHNSSKPAK
ncbi:MAG: hypothetical protein KAH18_06550 [Psychromonas sp.]|nr:hypothetical protein [Psychromonas sp.]